MRKVLLLGLVAGAVLVIGPMLVAYAEEGAKPAAREGARGEHKAPEGITLTEAQKTELQQEIADVEKTISALREKAIKVLGEQQGRQFTAGTIMKAMRAGMGEAGRGERKPGEGHRAKPAGGEGEKKAGEGDK